MKKPIYQYRDCLKLPFDRVALYSEQTIQGMRIQHISLAVSNNVIKNTTHNVDFFVSGIIKANGWWMPSRFVGITLPEKDNEPARVSEFDGLYDEEMKIYGYADELYKSSGYLPIAELMVMLSLSNVTTSIVEGPKRLNKKRIKKGKLPVYDYHVLTIDGKKTHDIKNKLDSDRTIRSHFRRGHIRTLQDKRKIWVKHCYVHGKKDGFIDKDYKVAI